MAGKSTEKWTKIAQCFYIIYGIVNNASSTLFGFELIESDELKAKKLIAR